jgi:AcrR family transcriptional regulator
MRADARRNQERIIAATLECFAEGGATGIVDIANRAGVGAGSIYRSFGSRSKLVETVYRHALAGLVSEANLLATTSTPDHAVESWLRSFITNYRAKRGMLQDLSAIFAHDPDLQTSSREQARAALSVVLSAAQQAGTVRQDVVAADLLSLVHGVIGSSAHGSDRDTLLVDVIMRGIRTTEPASRVSAP